MEPDRISLLLDNMLTVVEEGFSYDGIVSLPETGLEDAGKRPGLDGWVERRVRAYQKIMRIVRSALGFAPKSNFPQNDNPTDSGLGAGENWHGEDVGESGSPGPSGSPSPGAKLPRLKKVGDPTLPWDEPLKIVEDATEQRLL